MTGKIPTIEIRDLTIGYASRKGERVVASHIDAAIYGGELTCLLGANGIGKSTLLRTLSGFQPKLSGGIYLQGREIGDYKEKELSKILSVVLTEKPDLTNMTARGLIGLGRSPYTGFWGTLHPEDERIVDEVIALVRIEHLADRMVHTLSDGERQKVMIAKALAQQSPVIFLDEPTAFLDFPSKVEVMQLLHNLSRQTGKTIFLSTHDLELALQMADKICLMDTQSGLRTGVPEDLALEGKLSGFFARKGIIFDKDTGLFRVTHESARTIRMTGHGSRYLMARKALARNGIEVTRQEGPLEFIGIESDRITIQRPGRETYSVQTIEELLDQILTP